MKRKEKTKDINYQYCSSVVSGLIFSSLSSMQWIISEGPGRLSGEADLLVLQKHISCLPTDNLIWTLRLEGRPA